MLPLNTLLQDWIDARWNKFRKNFLRELLADMYFMTIFSGIVILIVTVIFATPTLKPFDWEKFFLALLFANVVSILNSQFLRIKRTIAPPDLNDRIVWKSEHSIGPLEEAVLYEHLTRLATDSNLREPGQEKMRFVWKERNRFSGKPPFFCENVAITGWTRGIESFFCVGRRALILRTVTSRTGRAGPLLQWVYEIEGRLEPITK